MNFAWALLFRDASHVQDAMSPDHTAVNMSDTTTSPAEQLIMSTLDGVPAEWQHHRTPAHHSVCKDACTYVCMQAFDMIGSDRPVGEM